MKKLVIIGGGFAGSKIAKSLETNFDVTLIDTKDYFEFTPSILKAIVSPPFVKEIQVMHTHYLNRAEFILGKVDKITKEEVYIGNKKIKFDYLVISSGSKYSFPFKEHDALVANRGESLRNHFSELEKSKSILIIGGGLSGVELAGEIVEKYPKKRLVIAHAAQRLIERQPEKASRYAKEFLKRRGVKVIFNELIKGSKKVGSEDEYFTNKGTKIKADISFLCVGITPNSDFMKKSFPKLVNERGYIATNEFLQLKGFKNIFVGGDVTDIKEEKTAQVSLEHANIIINNLNNLESNKKLKKYNHKTRAMILSLGNYIGILTYKNFVLTGIIPRIIKRHIQNKEMGFFKNG